MPLARVVATRRSSSAPTPRSVSYVAAKDSAATPAWSSRRVTSCAERSRRASAPGHLSPARAEPRRSAQHWPLERHPGAEADAHDHVVRHRATAVRRARAPPGRAPPGGAAGQPRCRHGTSSSGPRPSRLLVARSDSASASSPSESASAASASRQSARCRSPPSAGGATRRRRPRRAGAGSPARCPASRPDARAGRRSRSGVPGRAAARPRGRSTSPTSGLSSARGHVEDAALPGDPVAVDDVESWPA